MKLTSMLLAFTGCLVLVGCETPSPTLLSIDSVTTENDTKGDAALTGTWESVDDHGTLCIVRAGDPGAYEILCPTGSSTTGFHAQLFRVGDAELLDITPAEDGDFRVPGHAIARIWTGGTLRWAFLDSDWLKQQSAQLASRTSGSKMLLLSPGAAIRNFLIATAEKDEAYGKVVTWQRMQ